MLRRHLLAAAAPLAALPALAAGQAQGRGDLLDPGRPGAARSAAIASSLPSLVGADTDAHTYQPKPTDARALAAAQALVSNGLGFEGWIDRLAKAAPFKGRAIVATAGVATLQAAPTPGHSHAHGPDPHCWQDVGRARRYVGNIVEGLAAADAGQRRGLSRARPALRQAPRRRSTSGSRPRSPRCRRRSAAPSPATIRSAISRSAYGVQFLAPRGFTTESEPSAKDVAALIRQVREQKIKALFVENMSNPGLVDQIARESGAVVGPRLYSDALSGPERPGADLRGDDAPQRDGAGRGDAEELTPSALSARDLPPYDGRSESTCSASTEARGPEEVRSPRTAVPPTPRFLQRVVHQARHRHRPDAARHRREVAGDRQRLGEGDVAHQPRLAVGRRARG